MKMEKYWIDLEISFAIDVENFDVAEIEERFWNLLISQKFIAENSEYFGGIVGWEKARDVQ